MQPGMIPPELRALRQWVVWKTVVRDDRPTKVPYTPRTGLPARTHNSEGKTYSDLPSDTWGSFDEAVSAARRSKQWNGIGFVFTVDDPYCGIDLDHAAPGGRPSKEANEIVRLLDSYTERSPGGDGLHIIVRASLPPGGRRHGYVEMYDQGRYFTVTGDTLAGHVAIQDRQEQVERLHATIWQPEPPRRFALPKPTQANGDILDKARNAANGDKFRALYDHGLVHLYDDDDSRADLACCSILAFWYQGDQAAVDRAFRGSALYRSKWDERHGSRTYGQRTVERACLTKSEFYNPNGRTDHHANGCARVDPDTGEVTEYMATEFGDADRFVDAHGANVRYCADWQKWLAWDGLRWRPDAEHVVAELAKQTLRGLWEQARTYEDEQERAKRGKHAISAQREPYMRHVLTLARSAPPLPIYSSALDTNGMLLTCANGTLDLRTCSLRDADRADLITRLAPVRYDPQARADLWECFLRRVLPDDEVRWFVQRAAGYALTADVSEQCFFFLHGSGANGKSVLLTTLQAVMGEYALQAAPDLLLTKRSDGVPTDVAELKGRRLVATIEIDEGRRIAEGLVKQMTGGDRLKGRFMRQDFFEFPPTHKIWIAANHKPIIRGTDLAIWRRVMLVPFDVTIPEEERDAHLTEKLRAELSGILNWCVLGCQDWRENGLQAPQAVKAAVQSYRIEQDVIGRFIEERCVCGHGKVVNATRLFQAYRSWCESQGEKPTTLNDLGRELTARGFANLKRGGQMIRLGIDVIGEGLEV